MNHESVLIPQRMRTPRAAAIAGIIFSLLLITSMLLIWTSIPADPRGPATDVMNNLKALSFSLNLHSPLPRNTVAKKRSSSSPKRSRAGYDFSTDQAQGLC
jgi:hypothetical protein